MQKINFIPLQLFQFLRSHIFNSLFRHVKLHHHFVALRYYATFQVRKCELLLYKTNTFMVNYHLHWIPGRANIFCKCISTFFTHFFNFVQGFCFFFSMLFPKAPALWSKKIFERTFAAFYFYLYELKKYVLDF